MVDKVLFAVTVILDITVICMIVGKWISKKDVEEQLIKADLSGYTGKLNKEDIWQI